MNYVALPENVFNALVAYLRDKPYVDVQGFFTEFQRSGIQVSGDDLRSLLESKEEELPEAE